MKKYYVTMTDKFLSGWGRAEGKINKMIVVCDTYEQAETIERNASQRPEMKYINITDKKPYYNTSRYHVSWKEYSKLGAIWKE
jgi:hypothetical protein